MGQALPHPTKLRSKREGGTIPSMILSLLIASSIALAQDPGLNAGFVAGIWYSKLPFFAGETVRIYGAIQNRSGFDITGKARFFDKEKPVGENSFATLDGRLIEVWADWKAVQGEHSFSVEIVDAMKSQAGKKPEPITLSFPSSQTSQITVDRDTDGDRQGDQEDADDDNDGLSDKEELTLSTNPLLKDTDGNGVPDSQEPFASPPATSSDNGAVQQAIAKADEFIASLANPLERTLKEKQAQTQEEISLENPKKRILEDQLQKIEVFIPPSSLLLAKVPSFKELRLFLIQTGVFLAHNAKWVLLALGGLLILLLIRKKR